MSPKRHDYFRAGVRQDWMLNFNERTIAVNAGIKQHQIFEELATLRLGGALRGLTISPSEVHSVLNNSLLR